MKKGIIEPIVQDERNDNPLETQYSISEELQKAIENLITLMRERGPVKGL